MEIAFKSGVVILLSVLSGVFGRMGGAKGFDTKYRDVGCSLITLLCFCFLFGFYLKYWWVYLIVFGLHWGVFSTYWDWLFKFDNLWFSGFMCGLCFLVYPIQWDIVVIRSTVLAIIWGCLNKYLPKKVLIWRRDVAEEFLRYFSVPLTLLILLAR